MTKVKNLVYNKDKSIDMELLHPTHGWIPFTASKNDCISHGKAIYEEAIKGAYGAIADYVESDEVI